MSDGINQAENLWTADVAMSETIILAAMILAVVILALCLVLLIGRLFRKRRKRSVAVVGQTLMEDGSVTQELPVAAIQAGLQSMKTLADIVYCESEEIIL